MNSTETQPKFDPAKAIVMILAGYLLLSLAYISVTPFRSPGRLLSRMQDVVQQDIGAPDERQHTNYIRHLVREKAFPVFDPKSPDLYETYQSHQPPLYYLISAPFEAAFGANENTEMWGLRMVNVILGGLVIWGVIVGMRRLTGKTEIGIAAAAIAAFLPMFLALSTAVSNDMALFLVGVWVMNLIALGWERGWTRKMCLWLGLALGIGLLTKTTAAVLFPVALFGLYAKKESRPNVADVLAVFGVAALVALPWLIRNQNLYGDPLAIGAFQQASVGNLDAASAIDRAGGVLPYWFLVVFPVAIMGFWGVFGYFEIALSPATYWGFHVVGIVLLAGFVWSFSEQSQRRTNTLLLSMLVMVLAAFISYNLNHFQAQGRYLYPAVFAIVGMFAIGLRKLAGSEQRTLYATSVLAVLLIAVNVYTTFVLLPAAFELMQAEVSPSP